MAAATKRRQSPSTRSGQAANRQARPDPGPINCGPQVLIASITVTAIRDVVITPNVDHV
jgi:hypothetical protein